MSETRRLSKSKMDSQCWIPRAACFRGTLFLMFLSLWTRNSLERRPILARGRYNNVTEERSVSERYRSFHYLTNDDGFCPTMRAHGTFDPDPRLPIYRRRPRCGPSSDGSDYVLVVAQGNRRTPRSARRSPSPSDHPLVYVARSRRGSPALGRGRASTTPATWPHPYNVTAPS